MTDQSIRVVVIADDDQEDFQVLSLAIHEVSKNVVVYRAKNGEVLMQLLQEKKPDIVFLDLLMPCKDGMQCIREIRANADYDELPVVVYSSLDNMDTIEYCFQQRASLYAVKPLVFSGLKTMVEKILAIDWKEKRQSPAQSDFLISA